MAKIKKTNPRDILVQRWSDFLEARHLLIVALIDLAGKNTQEIVRILSMDPVQVRLIYETTFTHLGTSVCTMTAYGYLRARRARPTGVKS